MIRNARVSRANDVEAYATNALNHKSAPQVDPGFSEPESAKKLKPERLSAEFFGTDFNFLYSEEMQKTIFDNCLDANKQQLLTFPQY